MFAKRIAVLVASTVVGIVITSGLLFLIHLLQSNVTVGLYGYVYYILTAFFIGAAALVWIDHIMKTGILPR